jgi:hypothetical protein
LTELPTGLEAVIFDHSVLLKSGYDSQLDDELRDLLSQLVDLGFALVVFSSNAYDIQEKLLDKGFPPADLVLFERDVGAKKGSPRWVVEAARHLEVQAWQMVYVGDDDRDWKSAINGAVCYLQAAWAGSLPDRLTSLVVRRPDDVFKYLTHYLMTPPRWTYSLDVAKYGLHMRSLLPGHVQLPATHPPWFTLKRVFTHDLSVDLGGASARDLLMLHALSSLYLEGLIEPRSIFAVYPSHTPGEVSPRLESYLNPAASLFGARFMKDLLVREVEVVDTSVERGKKHYDRVTFSVQTNSVRVNPDRSGLFEGGYRNVVVFDDFTTTGMSLEWARNLLYAAGANMVILMTIGKWGRSSFGQTHRLHTPRDGVAIDPYALDTYSDEDFAIKPLDMNRDEKAEMVIRTSFEHRKNGSSYPLEQL